MNFINELIGKQNSESGFAFVAIILIVILIFSIMLVSGAEEFALSPDQPRDSSQPTATPQPTATQSANVNLESQTSTGSGFEELQENTEIIE